MEPGSLPGLTGPERRPSQVNALGRAAEQEVTMDFHVFQCKIDRDYFIVTDAAHAKSMTATVCPMALSCSANPSTSRNALVRCDRRWLLDGFHHGQRDDNAVRRRKCAMR